jgi:hypothetical protein
MPSDQVFVMVERVADLTHSVPSPMRDRAAHSVQRVVGRTGYATRWPHGLPTSRALAAQRCRGFVIATAIDAVEVTRDGARTQIRCSVSLRVAAWNGTDGGERWEPNTTATARASAATTSSSQRQRIDDATGDCLDSAITAATSERVVPFLRRISSAKLVAE